MNCRAWNLIKFKSSDPLLDCIEELSAVLGLPLDQAAYLVKIMLENYTLETSPYPEGLDRDLFTFLVWISSSVRIPVMTSKMDWVIDQISKVEKLETVLDYGAGGGRDCIFYANLGYSVTHADYASLVTPYIRRRFSVRSLDIKVVDVRNLADERYDVINCMDVLEHIYDMEYAVADIYARLNAGGRLFVFPNFVNSWNGDHIEKNCGYNGFFELLLVKAGLQLIDKVAINRETTMYHFSKPHGPLGSVDEERARILPHLYRFSAAQSHAAALIATEEFLRARSRDPSKMIDNYGIYRLCMQRLGEPL